MKLNARLWGAAIVLVLTCVIGWIVVQSGVGDLGAGFFGIVVAAVIIGSIAIPIQARVQTANRWELILFTLPVYVLVALVLSAAGRVFVDGLSCQVPTLCVQTRVPGARGQFLDALYYAAGSFLGGADDVLMPTPAGRVIAIIDRTLGWLTLGLAFTALTEPRRR